MKKIKLFLVSMVYILAITGVMFGGIIKASDQGTVTATVEIGTISVTIEPTSFDYGIMPLNNAKESFDVIDEEGVYNIKATVGTVVTDLDIKGADTTCTPECTVWTLGVTADTNQYIHKFGVGADGTTQPESYTALTTSYDDSVLGSAVPASGSVYFGLEITTPTSATTAEQSAAVSVRATWGG
jgi:hypothetical protein